MTRFSVPPVTARTTASDSGHLHGIVLGQGSTPMDALMELLRKAQLQAEALADSASSDDGDGAGEWRFEVVDVRITGAGSDRPPALLWAAYGTLVSADPYPGPGS
jgi:hypothetical protein